MKHDIPTRRSIVEGTLAQTFGGAASVVFVLTMASLGHQFPAGFETAFGTVLSILSYVVFKAFRRR